MVQVSREHGHPNTDWFLKCPLQVRRQTRVTPKLTTGAKPQHAKILNISYTHGGRATCAVASPSATVMAAQTTFYFDTTTRMRCPARGCDILIYTADPDGTPSRKQWHPHARHLFLLAVTSRDGASEVAIHGLLTHAAGTPIIRPDNVITFGTSEHSRKSNGHVIIKGRPCLAHLEPAGPSLRSQTSASAAAAANPSLRPGTDYRTDCFPTVTDLVL
mmetsp:Transcript_17034/g.50842  ORF Transcript_17034/g.50842 Transcript_17034/m.50842 type:complete len:217 (+) Transcript_17034:80-730(+)